MLVLQLNIKKIKGYLVHVTTMFRLNSHYHQLNRFVLFKIYR